MIATTLCYYRSMSEVAIGRGIAYDVDGVLSDTHGGWFEWFLEELGIPEGYSTLQEIMAQH